MLTVKTKIKQSPIHGIGLFADQFIPKGTLIWKLQKEFDVLFTKEEFFKLPKITQDYVMHYSHFDVETHCHVLCSDHARFFNKSETPNCGGESSSITIALRDIKSGEELTEIYFNLNDLKGTYTP